MGVEPILKKALDGERLSMTEGVALLQSNDLVAIGQVAHQIRLRKHPENLVTFVIDRNINYTNICKVKCRFCAFYRSEDDADAYVLSYEEIYRKIEETLAVGGTQILMQGGINPSLPFEWYLDLLKGIKERYNVHIHSFSPPEIVHLAEISGLSLKETIAALREAGLDSIPGGGAEILDNRVRHYISPRKITWEQWMEVMIIAHQLGMKTTATMMFGSVESPEERVAHMVRLREVQDQTGGFTAFIPWSFQPLNTELGGTTAGGFEYLKTLAVSRIMLDNFPNIQASWVTQGSKMAQISLRFGANDFGGTMLEENVVRAAGVTNRVPMDEIIRCIKDAGHRPAQRDTLYRIIRYFD
ncbi:cyclic dehypoxanthinyl futalosine synthase [Carboxydocella sporoproducens DSM 16521]|uniref:Cyclic dehypoxanthine futalosine synthase n=2 Tax=Carboxydocella TaxID=178898 RepID=A0A1T4PXP3_9FIRM|nr:MULTISPECIES: cyclic dehypoxanthinyl futalosine synthase [Carboxydocella]AVX20462.1 cyclic dehypoxanthinyl futalosine synthase [Carboxydocella thermautotrophica]AVX30883.1 cyclic dehypoxanthinyl futalosine synthase [Carboxydocella thermautotrophica]SJZ95738.1 cyclic dehypoxanthinyl futalosine synthase [Carboxydocella sporoproducens DSM 16521]